MRVLPLLATLALLPLLPASADGVDTAVQCPRRSSSPSRTGSTPSARPSTPPTSRTRSSSPPPVLAAYAADLETCTLAFLNDVVVALQAFVVTPDLGALLLALDTAYMAYETC